MLLADLKKKYGDPLAEGFIRERKGKDPQEWVIFADSESEAGIRPFLRGYMGKRWVTGGENYIIREFMGQVADLLSIQKGRSG